MADLTGRRLGNYELLGLLGKGGMAAVYRARQTNMKRDVAVKVIESDLAQTEEFSRRFEREVETIASFSHPHILKVFDFGRDEGLVYLVMELLPGGSLAEKIRSGPMPLPQVMELLDQIAAALDYAHNRGVVHRDMKPQNVMLDEAGNAFLTDFGIAKVMSSGTATLSTVAGTIMGTPAYMSPEQWKTQPVDARTDIYALGIILYEMLTGELPFKADTAFGLMHKHVNEEPPMRTMEKRFAPGIERVIQRALAKNPDDRYGSAGQLARDFRAAVDRHALTVSPFLDPKDAVEEDAVTLIEIEPEPGDGRDTKRLRDDVGMPLITTIPPGTPPPAGTVGSSGSATPPSSSSSATSTIPPQAQTMRLRLIAGVIVLLVFGAIIFAALSNGSGSPTSTPAPTTAVAVIVENTATTTSTLTDTVQPTNTDTAVPTETATSTLTPSLTYTPTETLTPTINATGTTAAQQTADAATAISIRLGTADSVIATNSAPTRTYTPTLTFTPSATSTITPSATLTFTPSATLTATLTFTPSSTPAACVVTVTGSATPMYSRAASNAPQLGFLVRDQQLPVQARFVDPQGIAWLLVTGRVGTAQRTGWVQQRSVRVAGDCDTLTGTVTLPAPTVPMTPTSGTTSACVITVTGSATPLYSRAALNAPQLGFLERGQELTVSARVVQQGIIWLEVTGRVGTANRTGWIQASFVRTSGDCDAVPEPTSTP
ncbi:MAG: protein kinase [Anaerolineae bacterium]|nr:protein kinase [Anaerolineae bacterium]